MELNRLDLRKGANFIEDVGVRQGGEGNLRRGWMATNLGEEGGLRRSLRVIKE